MTEEILEYVMRDMTAPRGGSPQDAGGTESVPQASSLPRHSDGAIPSGNSIQFYNLLKLARLTGNPELEKRAVEAGAPFTKDQQMLDGKPTVYICRNCACEKPINSLEELKDRFN